MAQRIMIVDDEPDVLLTVKALLEKEGLAVITAGSGKACLEELGKGFKGLILMDVMMPVMDGWAVIKAIIEGGYAKGNIICMLTAKDTPDTILAEYNQYVVEYIRKPSSPKVLVQIVKDYLALLDL
jgi:CheY-like chemotaxis protein